MIGIVIVAHGELAGAFLSATEHVIGQQSGLRAVTIDASDDREAKRREIAAAADAVDSGSGVVFVTDLFGGSPSNLCLGASATSGRRVIYGANLPMLIKLAKSRDLPLADAVSAATLAGRKYIDSLNISHNAAAPQGEGD